MTDTTENLVLDLLKKELKTYSTKQLTTVLDLLAEGNTVPFIARYRKEMTGTLDEVQIREIEERYNYLQKDVIRTIEEQGKLTPELKKSIEIADKMQLVEDLYRPFKQKRRTKATIAKESGLEPLAEWLLSFPSSDVLEEATKYINEENGVESAELALSGAHEIIAEKMSDEPRYRIWIREYTLKNGLLTTVVKKKEKDEKGVFEMYYDYKEPVNKLVSHRILAINRGEKEDILKTALVVNETVIFNYLVKEMIKDENSTATPYIKTAIEDSYKRFVGPSIEREIRSELTEQADTQAINIFGENLRN
ncbi:MAG: Tex-like N-terminal domain-containing protein, partial [Carnobacterium sp.]